MSKSPPAAWNYTYYAEPIFVPARLIRMVQYITYTSIQYIGGVDSSKHLILKAVIITPCLHFALYWYPVLNTYWRKYEVCMFHSDKESMFNPIPRYHLLEVISIILKLYHPRIFRIVYVFSILYCIHFTHVYDNTSYLMILQLTQE